MRSPPNAGEARSVTAASTSRKRGSRRDGSRPYEIPFALSLSKDRSSSSMAGKRTGLRQAQPERTNRNTQKGVDNMRFASALLASAALLAAAPVHAKPADPEAAKKILKDSELGRAA